MKHYIDKDDVVAEIRKRLLPVIRDKHYDEWEEGQNSERIALLGILDTFEVKEVDLDKSARNYLLNEHKSPLNDVFHQCDLRTEMQYHQDIENAYKAGFKLGIKAQKGE
jgi:hypothetical protein